MIAGRAAFAVPILAVVAFAASLGWLGYRHGRSDPPASAPDPAPAASAGPTSSATDLASIDRATTQSVDQRRPTPEAGLAARPADAAVPAFDVVRVEPAGDAVVAGRAPPGAVVEMIVDGTSFARTTSDAAGAFVLVAPTLPPGSHEIVLRATSPDGVRVLSAQNVTAVVAENRRDPPLVTVTAPGLPAVVLSRPDDPPSRVASAPAAPSSSPPTAGIAPPKPATASVGPTSPLPLAPRSVEIASVETEGAGRLHVSGTAPPGSPVRLYLNDAFIATGTAGSGGRVAFTIERGITPGGYKVRLDGVEGSGKVLSRAEVPFAVPASAAPNQKPTRTAAIGTPAGPAATGSGTPAPAAAVPPAIPAPSSDVVVAAVTTATVTPGESLWAISKRAYGNGVRYTVIYGANSRQIRDPNLIYPGQLFVVPAGTR